MNRPAPKDDAAPAGGFTLAEVVLTLLVLALALAPLILAFVPSLRAADYAQTQAVFVSQANGTLSRITALPYDQLATNLGASVSLGSMASEERFTHRGVTYTPVVGITDASGGTGGLIRLSVTVESVQLSTLKASP